MNHYQHAIRLSLLGLILLLPTALLITGCKTGQPASASFASVVISGRTPDEICQTTAKVFQEDGYSVGSLSPSGMLFQKQGTRGQSLAYGGLGDTVYGSTTAVRVRASVADIGGSSHRLQCKAWMVRDANDSFFEEEQPLLNVRSRPYQNLLNKVAKQLK
jgi:hypothetical protein